MNDDDRSSPADIPLAPATGTGEESLSLQHQELGSLRSAIGDLLRMAEEQAKDNARNHGAARLIPQLRAANEHLVKATLIAQEAQTLAETLNQRQNEFLMMLAHELRNPLQPIVVANYMLGQLGARHPDIDALHAILGRQVGQLVRLVDDLMDASCASSGKFHIQHNLLTLQEVVDSALETCAGALDARQQQLQLDLPAQAVTLNGDLQRLSQVLVNLLLNASKYTPPQGHIGLRAVLKGACIELTVSDDGAGISAALLPQVFKLFAQGPRPTHGAPGGLGIGLALVRSIVELHGGSVRASSAGPGLGSQFCLSLPCLTQAAPAGASRAPCPQPAVPCSILYIDAQPDASAMLRHLLQHEGHQVDCRSDARAGLLAAQENGYDAVICDVAMPGMDGDAIAHALRQQGRLPTPCLIALSGFPVLPEEAPQASGFDHYLVKPISIPALTTILRQLERRQPLAKLPRPA